MDIVIKNGQIADGSGSKMYNGDIGIKNGKIAAIDTDILTEGTKVIDAAGSVVAPGFIDLHSHSDLWMLNYPSSDIKIRQGVTTEIYGNCGFSAAPVFRDTLDLFKAYSEPVMGRYDQWNWNTYRQYIENSGILQFAHNVGGLVGNGTLRTAVKGFEAGALNSSQMDRVKGLLREALDMGAFGLSLGLMYAPENYYDKNELIEICKVLKEYDALLTAHIRGEGNSLLESLNEVIDISIEAEVPLHISHLKAAGKNNWGDKCLKAIEIIEEARSQGHDITCDVYPYTAGSTTLASLLPPWALEGGIGKTLQRLQVPEVRRKVYDELNMESDRWDNLVCSTGWDNVVVSSLKSQKANEGKSIARIADDRGSNPADCMLDLLIEEEGTASIVFFHMSEQDVITIMKKDYCSIISDSIYSLNGVPHPRLYGAFPRLFAAYVRDKGILTLEEAVRKVTSMPADRIGLNNRGRLNIGTAADIVVFDPEKIRDTATYTDPRQYPEGIRYVITNGKLAAENGKYIGAASGVRLIKVR